VGDKGRLPEEWARELGAGLHGMGAEQWDAYVRYLDSEDEIAQAFRALVEEGDDLNAALRADKFVRPENRELRLVLSQALHERRVQRLADLQDRRREVLGDNQEEE
jgi:hypothetical protein